MAKEASSPSQTVAEVNACVSTSSGRRPAKETTFREWLVENQIGISVTILAMLLAVHNLYPSLRPYTAPFFQLSYYQPSKGVYIQGWDDIYYVIGSAIGFTAVRAIAIDWIFRPLARWAGLKKKKPSLRFAEQAWLLVYYGFFWSYGMYLWSHSYYWADWKAIWSKWPAREMDGLMKWYLLTQLSFWSQQILVINIEERRKDHYQMLTHHIITSTLLGSAYVYGFYNVSNVVLCLMDIVDFLLPAAKMLKYLGYEMCCNVAFGVFLVTWFIARHVLYLSLCWSIYKGVPQMVAYGCYSNATAEMYTTDGYPDRWMHLFYPFLDINGPICINRGIKWIFLSFLLFLQVLSLIWFGMIIRVAVGVLRTGNAEDTRSDDEDEEEVESEAPVNVVTGKERGGAVIADNSSSEPAWRRSNPPRTVRTRGRGRLLGDQSDRKELLGRIGCDKPT
ncbi:hypothetical protein VTN00DRAFT_1478 [Thermoascus crustaceus]|uniref:uncharacterized protein n=1 Tax=Thermoascus crustaceus TaxID=5088 RepID=UPI003743F5EA